MEKRHSLRKTVHVGVRLTIEGTTYDAFIDNVSYEGIGANIVVIPAKALQYILPETVLEMQFQTGTLKGTALKCVVKWLNISADDNGDIIYMIGSEIIKPPAKYKKFVQSL